MTNPPCAERRIIEYHPGFRNFLAGFARPIALVSPAIFDILGEKASFPRLERAFRSIGFSELRAISFNKYGFIDSLIRESAARRDGPVLFSACPLARELIAAEYPDMLARLTQAIPPADRAARAARDERPDATLFWIAPCSSRSMPLLDGAKTGVPFVDYLVPLHTMFPAILKAAGIPPESVTAYCGTCGQPAAKGPLAATDTPMRVIASPRSIRRYLDRLSSGADTASGIVELIACSSGCSDGDWAPKLVEE